MSNSPNIPQCQGILYTIQRGDTFYSIAQRYNISVQSLISANPQIVDPSRIVPGQVICVPVSQPGGCPGQIYIVRSGDTLYTIAQRFEVTIQQILEVNPQITNPNVISVGQSICIPVQPAPTQDCAIVLSLSGAAIPALPALAGGVVLVQSIEGGQYALTFAATGIPTPETIGAFNAYIGTLNVGGQQYSAILGRTAPFGQEPTWSGTRDLPFNPLDYPEATVTIAAFNIEQDIRANPILGGTMSQCRR